MRHSFASGVTYRLTYRVDILTGIDTIALLHSGRRRRQSTISRPVPVDRSAIST